jgi:hypothetical protein
MSTGVLDQSASTDPGQAGNSQVGRPEAKLSWLAVRLDPDWVAVGESSSGRLGILFEHGVELGLGFPGPLLPLGDLDLDATAVDVGGGDAL